MINITIISQEKSSKIDTDNKIHYLCSNLGKMARNRTYTYIDLFAGTSALSEGFLRHGFVPVAHVEMNEDACFTIKTRLAYHYLNGKGNITSYTQYLKGEIDRDSLYKLVPDSLISSVINK